MLKQIIEAARLRPEFCAGLLRVPLDQFRAWMEGQAPIPQFVVPELCTVLGISQETLASRTSLRAEDRASLAPAIWFKLRSDSLTDADRELVGAVRRLGFLMAQLEAIREVRSVSTWRVVARSVLEQVDRSAPPSIQGRVAAIRFRSACGLEHGQAGIGEILRPKLRQSGLVVIESPIPKSSLEGCCFTIGSEVELRPCIFANTFKSTWFRRNQILLHEACHAIFDIDNDQVALDFRDGERNTRDRLSEARATAFALDVLLPKTVLRHYTNQLGINWLAATPSNLAQLMSLVHVEQGALLQAAYQSNLITDDELAQYSGFNCGVLLREFSPHAISTREYLARVGHPPKWIAENRTATVGARRLRLPVGYVDQVLETLKLGDISVPKAAELLMMDRYSFEERFGDLVTEVHPV